MTTVSSNEYPCMGQFQVLSLEWMRVETLLPIVAYTGRFRSKGEPLSGFRNIKGLDLQDLSLSNPVEVYEMIGKSLI